MKRSASGTMPRRPSKPSAVTTQRMRNQAQRDTAPEMALRRELHRRGLRYRIHRRPVPNIRREADVVFPRQQVAVLVDGCWWHQCPQHATLPKSNVAWWKAKLDRNVARDRETDRLLTDAGWQVVRIWEHEIPEAAADKVQAALIARSTDAWMVCG